jgi:hypothetical protein
MKNSNVKLTEDIRYRNGRIRSLMKFVIMIICAFLIAPSLPVAASAKRHVYPLATTKGLTALNGLKLAAAIYRGKRAVALTEKEDPQFGVLGVVFPIDFKDGTIEFDEAGLLTERHNPTSRSFVGIAFHVSDDLKRYECFYLRMTNGRSPNQELRNHAVQYCMFPDHRWDELRKTHPFRYEAYTDLELGAWTHIKISIRGTEARFYVGRAKQPTLVVHDLIMGPTHGKLALWVGGYTRAYFSHLRVHAA